MKISKIEKHIPAKKQFLFFYFLLLVSLMLAVTLYPYNFSPPANGPEWLTNESGIYFNSSGIAYTDKGQLIPSEKQVTIELWLKERSDSKNWGPRDIFSFYDGKPSPPLLIGQYAGHIYLFSRFELSNGEKWYNIFQSQKRFERGKPHLVAVTFGDGEKAIYIDGELENKNKIDVKHKADIHLSGRLVIGNSPKNKKGWWGEIKGLAIYNRILSLNEIKRHSSEVPLFGMRKLAEASGSVALYTFEEGDGNKINSITGDQRPFCIPARKFAIPDTIFHLPFDDMRIESIFAFNMLKDFLPNIFFFLPYGVLLSIILIRTYQISYFYCFFIVILTGGLFSFSVEFAQLFFPTRTSGMSDVLSNTLGSGLGFLVACSLKLRT